MSISPAVRTMVLAGWFATQCSQAAPLTATGTPDWPGFANHFPAEGEPNANKLSPAPSAGSIQDQATQPAGEPRKIFLIMPPFIEEGGDSRTVTLKVSRPLNISVKFGIIPSPEGVVNAPPNVTLKAGQRSVSFPISAKDDEFTSLNRLAGLTLFVRGTTFEMQNFTRILDDEKPPGVTLKLPSEFREGDATEREGTITLSRALEKEGFIDLFQSSRNQLTAPGQVTIPAGKKEVTFRVSAFDDEKIDGDVTMVVSANAGPRVLSQQRVKVWDNETRQLSLLLPPSVQEGNTTTGTVSIPGTIGSDLVVSLSDGTSDALKIPASVTIPAGQTSATFKINSRENSLRDGSHNVNITAKAKNFPPASQMLVVLDDEVSGFQISGFGDLFDPSKPVNITISAVDVEGNMVPTYFGRVDLNAILANGTNVPLTPSYVTLIAGSAKATVTLPKTSSLVTGVTASDSIGNVGQPARWNTFRKLTFGTNLYPSGMVWDEKRQKIYAMVPGAALPLQVIDPDSMKVVNGIAPGPLPSAMAITSGGEYLYVSLTGNGTIAKIDPDSMTVVATIAVGSDELARPLFAADLVTVPDHPELVIAARSPISANVRTNTVAIYDSGIPRESATPSRDGGNFLEPTSDPSVFFDFNRDSNYRLSRRLLKIDTNGISEVPDSKVAMSGSDYGNRSAGEMIFTPDGLSFHGLEMTSAGRYSAGGAVCTDVAANRIFYLEDRGMLAAYDTATRKLTQEIKLPVETSTYSMPIRCGANGLAFSANGNLCIVRSSSLFPSAPAADLSTHMEATSFSAKTGAPVTFTVKVTNEGPATARNAYLSTRFSGSPGIISVTTSKGFPQTSVTGVEMPIGDLAVGKSAILNVTVTSNAAGSTICTTRAGSDSIDPDFSNNTNFKLVNFGYQSKPDSVNNVGIIACSQVVDRTRNLIWLAIPSYDSYYTPARRIPASLSQSVVSLDPLTGKISAPIALGGEPVAESMGLSGNGRYLYLGLQESGEVSRIDLQANPPQTLRIPLPPGEFGLYPDAGDIEVLEGDGTSILLATSKGESVMVIDGTTPRSERIIANPGTDARKIAVLDKTSNPAMFMGYSFNNLYQLSLSGTGVAITGSRVQPYGVFTETSGNGELWLWNTSLFYVNTLAQKTDLLPWGLIGGSFLDNARQRAYFLNSTEISCFNTESRAVVGTFKVVDYDWQMNAKSLARWGTDGFSIVSHDAIILARWSLAAPVVPSSMQAAAAGVMDDDLPTADTDDDGIPNAFEQLFATSPSQFDANPVRISSVAAGGQNVIHLTFPRRAGLAMPAYGYETSGNLIDWQPAANVTETIVSTRMIDGVEVETIDASVPVPSTGGGFVRLRWPQQ